MVMILLYSRSRRDSGIGVVSTQTSTISQNGTDTMDNLNNTDELLHKRQKIDISTAEAKQNGTTEESMKIGIDSTTIKFASSDQEMQQETDPQVQNSQSPHKFTAVFEYIVNTCSMI